MLLDPRPKKTLKDLFGRDDEVQKLQKSISANLPLIVISGLRRIGKTSLLTAVLNETVDHFILLDPRDLGRQEELNKIDVLRLIQNSVQSFLNIHRDKADKIIDSLRHVKGILLPTGAGIQFDFTPNNEIDLTALFQALDKWANDNDTKVILAIDETQELAKVNGFSFDTILAGIFDKCDNIIIVLTGSEMGLLYEFLGDNDSTRALYGRPRDDIKLKSLPESLSKQFLIKGFREKGINPEIDVPTATILNNAVQNLDGIIGWLIIFACKCISSNRIDESFILTTKQEGSVQARREFEKFANTKKNPNKYIKIMKELQKLQTTSQYDFIKMYAEGSAKKEVVELVTEQFIIEIGGKYFFGDPLLQYSFEIDKNSKNG